MLPIHYLVLLSVSASIALFISRANFRKNTVLLLILVY